ncbi:metallophosphoesterase family protein [Geofilum rubicundum]|uniref:Phosphoesterase n=1 Tax=Geofilum rubicundum JCM 15548 TaxID=1236989 RepID=A0A0E9LRJ3_9BACT|nr:metallophosphoesterase family protein [Geofilum rubicundum]GAO27776.1 hypothetical protein JCM15548_14627 [Geofilum rubicundum JCM 15548]
MQKIGLLSDTHAFFDPKFYELFREVDQIWHAGDIGSELVLDAMEAFKPVRAVYGNIDGAELRRRIPAVQRFSCEGVDVLITHIGGYPGKYAPQIKQQIFAHPPKLFICGHSHILKVINDPSLKLLHVNPGAAGKYGFHTVRTAIRFTLDQGDIRDMEVIELADR